MNNDEYIRATNRAKVSVALGCMRDVQPGDDYGITDEECTKIKVLLREAEKRLFSSFELKGECDE